METVEINFRDFETGRIEPCVFDNSEEAIISILEHFKKGFSISFISCVARVCFDVEKSDFYFIEV